MASLLALLSSALWGTADFFGGKLSKKYPAFVVLGAQQFFGFLTGVILVVVTGAWSAQALGSGGHGRLHAHTAWAMASRSTLLRVWAP